MGAILGGLLSGIGKGMETQALHNREMALEELRNKRVIEQEKRGEIRAIAKDERVEAADNRAAKRDHGLKIDTMNRAGEISSEQAKEEFGRKLSFAQVEHNFALARDNNNAAHQKSLQRMKQDSDSGDVTHFETTDTGQIVGFKRGGGVIEYNIKAQPKPKTKEEVQASKTYTRAEAAYTAKQTGKTVEQVMKDMRDNGYTLERGR